MTKRTYVHLITKLLFHATFVSRFVFLFILSFHFELTHQTSKRDTCNIYICAHADLIDFSCRTVVTYAKAKIVSHSSEIAAQQTKNKYPRIRHEWLMLMCACLRACNTKILLKILSLHFLHILRIRARTHAYAYGWVCLLAIYDIIYMIMRIVLEISFEILWTFQQLHALNTTKFCMTDMHAH